MDWLAENLGKIISFVIFILYIVVSLKGKGEQEAQDPEEEARARRIQEEIRRKILDRQNGPSSTQRERPEPEILFEDTSDEEVWPWEREPRAQEPVARAEEKREIAPSREPEKPRSYREEFYDESSSIDDYDPYEEQRREIEKQLAKAAELQKKADAVRKAKGIGSIAESSIGKRPVSPALGELWDAGLGSQKSLRNAIVLREILDKPIGLR